MKEDVDYELITREGVDDHWGIRILTGKFNESVVQIGALAFNEVKDHLSFNFEVLDTPDPDWVTTDNIELQETVGEILNEILRTALDDPDNGLFEAKERI